MSAFLSEDKQVSTTPLMDATMVDRTILPQSNCCTHARGLDTTKHNSTTASNCFYYYLLLYVHVRKYFFFIYRKENEKRQPNTTDGWQVETQL